MAALINLNQFLTDPATTTSTTPVMMGFGSTCKVTPTTTGRVLASFTGRAFTDSSLNATVSRIRYGTGTAPSYGAAGTGTVISGGVACNSANPGKGQTITCIGMAASLTIGTAYWFDLDFVTTGGIAGMNEMSFLAFEV